MQLNADLSQRAVMRSSRLDWVPSPAEGIHRKMLERDGEEVARATSIVWYAQGSQFPTHIHGGGEEILVLEGVFQDENGDYPAGTWIRSPHGSSHAPFSEKGCLIYVKVGHL